MTRFFNTTGPCDPARHYMLPPEDRLVGAQLDKYVGNQLYWVLHAPRQTGKTTFLQSWMRELNASGEVVACYVSVERCQEFPMAADAIPAICDAIQDWSRIHLGPGMVPPRPEGESASLLGRILTSWAALTAPKPLVVLFDEVDVLHDQAMVSFLRQLRGGFAARGVGVFPVSVALVGLRDLRDYLVRSKNGASINPGSPFNIKHDSATLANFSREDVRTLVGQHVSETGQIFASDAIGMIWDITRGQPWLTNALCLKCVWTLCPKGEPVTMVHIGEARELLIRDRAVHLDSLAERLHDPRVKRIVEAILTGESSPEILRGDDFRYTLDMGLVAIESGTPTIANPIYREVVVRVLSEEYQLMIQEPEFRWKTPDGRLDLDALMREFQVFWRRHAGMWEEKADYAEAFPHLLVMAFLQRVVNGGGRIEREFAAGRGRADLAVWYGGAWSVIEIKLVHPGDGPAATIQEGLRQVARYRDRIDPLAPACLIVFDRTVSGRAKTWTERLTREEFAISDIDGDTVSVFGG